MGRTLRSSPGRGRGAARERSRPDATVAYRICVAVLLQARGHVFLRDRHPASRSRKVRRDSVRRRRAAGRIFEALAGIWFYVAEDDRPGRRPARGYGEERRRRYPRRSERPHAEEPSAGIRATSGADPGDSEHDWHGEHGLPDHRCVPRPARDHGTPAYGKAAAPPGVLHGVAPARSVARRRTTSRHRISTYHVRLVQ